MISARRSSPARGADGLQEITQDVTYIDGVQTDINTVSVVTLQEPVSEYVTKGTHLKSGMTATYGSGEWMWPVPQYTYVSRWMRRSARLSPYGVPIYASDSGVVVTAGYHYSYGNYVVIDHGNGWRTLYGHMSSLGCSSGQAVQRGQVIGYIGSTGNSTGNHCHFEMYQNGSLGQRAQFLRWYVNSAKAPNFLQGNGRFFTQSLQIIKAVLFKCEKKMYNKSKNVVWRACSRPVSVRGRTVQLKGE